ncbi:MAG: haloacid dehalogenase-like hydrolase [candidate division BRC1 bacterium ADurb.BinA364]|nr:MAG: haloacid dehalogenase-like hydrolase [candidate division BRC1 bacterium ADurb.BinA364]
MELVSGRQPATPPRVIVFDFDGTVSLVRAGWADTMADLAVETLRAAGARDEDAALRAHSLNRIMELNGKPPIHQMRWLAAEALKHGGAAPAPETLLIEYQARLMRQVEARREALRSGKSSVDSMRVAGVSDFLPMVRRRGAIPWLISGTAQRDVQTEAELLDVAGAFENRIVGAPSGDAGGFSKREAIERALRQAGASGAQLASFGDGHVEIAETRALGGFAIAIASDERERSGRPDAWKRERLIEAGADAVAADFRDADSLIAYLWGTSRE